MRKCGEFEIYDFEMAASNCTVSVVFYTDSTTKFKCRSYYYWRESI